MRTLLKAALATTAIIVATAPSAGAAVTFDPATGNGFVGKGDVQTVLNLNNNDLQKKAGTFQFTYEAVTAQETTWICINERNQNEQERSLTTTTETSGVASSIERVKNQITGFNLNGYTSSTSTETTEGNKLNSCPNANSTYALDSTTVGEPTVISGGLFVNGVLLQ